MLPLKYEVMRKTIHLMMIFVPIVYWAGFSREFLASIIISMLTGILVLEILRVDFRQDVPLLRLFRSRELGLSGASFMLLGVLIALIAFSKPVAIVAMLMTILGDSASALVGKSIGRIRVWGPRNIEGILAEFFVDIFVGWYVFNRFGLPIWPVLAGSLVATLTETLTYRIDDNLVIPLFAGITMSFFMV